MALSSTSTIAQALAQYNDNLSWDTDPDKAVLALEAVRFLLMNRPESQSDSHGTMNYADLAFEKRKLEAFVSASSDANRSSFTRGSPLLS